jgi:UrcA family protein
MSIFTTTRLVSVLALAAFATPVVASAEVQNADTRVAVVSFSGLDPARADDQAVLRHRIAVAAHKVCEQVTQGDSMASPGYTECFSRAVADARSQLDSQVAMASSRAMVASITAK